MGNVSNSRTTVCLFLCYNNLDSPSIPYPGDMHTCIADNIIIMIMYVNINLADQILRAGNDINVNKFISYVLIGIGFQYYKICVLG